MKQLQLKKGFLISNERFGIPSIYGWLLSQKLHGKESRNRTRFLKILEEHQKQVDEDRKNLLEEHTERDKDGNLLYETSDENGKVTISTKGGPESSFKIADNKRESLEKTMQAYVKEVFKIDNTPERREAITVVKDLLLNSEDEFSGVLALRYEEWCDAFEHMVEVKND